jgi:iron(II)-dependent oxidoreductase
MDESFLPVPGEPWRLGKYPVTVEEYQRFVDARGYEGPGWWSADGWGWKAERGWSEPADWESQLETPNRPVVGVSWWEAPAYCLWFSDLRGRQIRLPTEDEWERAATHPDGPYPWGAEEPDEDQANFSSDLGKGNVRHPTPVGIYPRGDGQYGHSDLCGNVWEWCRDELDGGKGRPLRAGCWWIGAEYLRSAVNDGYEPVRRSDGVGFRVLCAPSRSKP